jgi:hypothetical protein
MSWRCGLLGWHSFRLVRRDAQKGATVECKRCRHRLRVASSSPSPLPAAQAKEICDPN